MLSKSDAISLLNKLGKEGTSFKFYCDFLGEKWCVDEEDSNNTFQLELTANIQSADEQSTVDSQQLTFNKNPIPFPNFKKSFDKVVRQINIGNSFLTNLTCQTPIETNLSLEEIYHQSQAKYKLLVPDQFVVFSPETFVQIMGNEIHSYPMKGTIDANIPNAESIILNDVKEKAEHVTIVDLIRNDLSQVSKNVEVSKFRFINQLKTNEKNLLQVSSEIRGELDENWKSKLGTILSKLLPAGSISGAPKPETVKIIQKAENYHRGFYTGICGYFDGQSLDTGVMIRFIKKADNQLCYCSGGGITSFSEAKKEYQEMVDKVYLAI